MKRLYNLLICLFLVKLLLLLHCVLLASISQLVLELLYDIKISVCDLLIVFLDVLVFTCMLLSELFDSLIFLSLYLQDSCFPLLLHVFSKKEHLMLELRADLVANALKFGPH